MQKLITLIAKGCRLLVRKARIPANQIFTWWKFYSNNIQFNNFRSNGIPIVMVAKGGSCSIGSNFRMNNGNSGNPIGRPQKCIFFVDSSSSLIIGNNVGISSTALVAHKSIVIGDFVKIGAGVCIYDTDFHSIDSNLRADRYLDMQNKLKAGVVIKDYAFIGAHTTILKGVTVGKNSIVGACSVVTKNIPDNEIWAGNPAKFIKHLSSNSPG